MYSFMASLSIIIRNFVLPNPLSKLEHGTLINLGMEPILFMITYSIVGLFYRKGSFPALGSFLYLFFYAVHTFLLMLCGTFDFNEFAVASILVLYALILIGIMALKNKMFSRMHF